MYTTNVFYYYSAINNPWLKFYNEDIDNWNIETIDFFENNEQIRNLEKLKEDEVSRVVVSFFDYLERGKSKIKRKYSQSLLSLRMYQEDFKIVEQFGSKDLHHGKEGSALHDHLPLF